jgi:hypothetical protein
VPLELFFVTPSGEKKIVFLKPRKKGEFWTFVPNVNLTNCSNFFDIKQFFKNKKKFPLSQT